MCCDPGVSPQQSWAFPPGWIHVHGSREQVGSPEPPQAQGSRKAEQGLAVRMKSLLGLSRDTQQEGGKRCLRQGADVSQKEDLA